MRTVVTGVDRQQQSSQVLRHALAEARATGRPLEVLHAWSTPTWPPGAGALDDTEGLRTGRAEAEELAGHVLAKALAEPTSAGGNDALHAAARARHGDAGDQLVRASAEAGLVVVGARRHGALLSAVLGSATAHVLHHAPCPVMVVPRSAADGPYRRVVVGVDREGHAGSALRWALDAARRHGCPLVVLHALPRTTTPSRPGTQERDARHEDDVHTWLATVVARAARLHADVPLSMAVHDGEPLDVLLQEAGADDLLVLGSRGRTVLSEVLLGAVAVQCAQQAAGTVVVVRTGQERLDDPAVDEDATRAQLLTTGT